MKKLVILNSSLHNSPHVLAYAISTAKQYGYELEGFFIPESIDTRPSYPFPNDLALTEEAVTSETPEEENAKLTSDYIQYFIAECEQAGVSCKVTQEDYDMLFALSSSADALLMDARYRQHTDNLATFMSKLKCPVIAVSESSSRINNVIFGFDGSDDSEYAIRKYNELFPVSGETTYHLVTVNKELEYLEDRVFITDFLEKKYKGISLHHLQGDESVIFIDFVRQFPLNSLVVMGAYGRSAISRFFKPSMAEKVFHETQSSVFLAHR